MDEEKTKDLEYRKGNFTFPTTIFFSPFSALIFQPELLVTLFFILFSFIDYFLSQDGQIAKKYIEGFSWQFPCIFFVAWILKLLAVYVASPGHQVLIYGILFFMFVGWCMHFNKGWKQLFPNYE